MKKILSSIFVFCLIFSIAQSSFALSTSENIVNKPNFAEKIKVRKFIKDITKYSNQKNLAKVKEFYSKDFKNTDNSFDYGYDYYYESSW